MSSRPDDPIARLFAPKATDEGEPTRPATAPPTPSARPVSVRTAPAPASPYPPSRPPQPAEDGGFAGAAPAGASPLFPRPVVGAATTAGHGRAAAGVDAQLGRLTLAPPDPASLGESAAELNYADLLARRTQRPHGGWRGLLYTCTWGLINLGPSPREQELAELRARVLRRLGGVHRVTVLSIKGGVGKTTTVAGLGLTLAELRGDQTVVVDANPAAGTLAERLTGPAEVTVRHLLDDAPDDAVPTSLDAYLGLAGDPPRLRVLASQQDPAAAGALTADEYERVLTMLARNHNITITDCGTGVWHPTMTPALAMAHSLIVVGALTVDGITRAAHTLDWLAQHGHEAKARDAIVVLSGDRRSRDVDAEQVHGWFARRARAVVEIPFDPHLATGARIDLDELRRPTRDAFLELAALVADQFPARPPLALAPAEMSAP